MITRMNKERGYECKVKCGLLGIGAKTSLDYQYNPPAHLTRSGYVSPSTRAGLRSRNLDGEGSSLIRPEVKNPEKAYFSYKVENNTLGSI